MGTPKNIYGQYTGNFCQVFCQTKGKGTKNTWFEIAEIQPLFRR